MRVRDDGRRDRDVSSSRRRFPAEGRLQQLRHFHRRCRRHQQEAQVARQRGWCEICFRDENFAELSLLQMVIDTYIQIKKFIQKKAASH